MLKISREYSRKTCLLLMSICIIIFITVQQYNISNFITGSMLESELYVVQPDTGSYLIYDSDFILHPFASFRSPGYPLFLKLFTIGKSSKIHDVYQKMRNYKADDLWNYGRGYKGIMAAQLFQEEGLAPALNMVVIVQFLVLCFSVVFLYYSLLPKNASFLEIIVYGLLLLICLYIVPIPSIRWIMSESLGQPFLFISIGFLLSFHKKQKAFLIYLACFFSVYTFLIRPAALVVVMITTLYLIYLLFKDRLKHKYEYTICGSILFIGYAYILLLSITCGNLSFGTIQYAVSMRRIVYFLEENDIDNMPTQRARKASEKLLEEKAKNYPLVMSELKKRFRNKSIQSISLANRYFHIAEPLSLQIMGIFWQDKEWRDREIKDFGADLTRLTREIEQGLSINHSRELFKIRLGYLLTTIGVIKDWKAGILSRLGIFPSIIALIILILAFALCKDIRFLIIILASTHILSVLAIAYSHVMLDRYYSFTELIYILSITIAIYSLLRKILSTIQIKKLTEILRITSNKLHLF